MKLDFIKALSGGAAELGLTLEREAIARLQLYWVELWKWSRKSNLVAKGIGEEELLANHFLDSLSLLPHLSGSVTHLLDVGSGAGFPGLVCAGAAPDMTCSLVEPRLKRVSFLRHVARGMGLSRVRVYPNRLEEVGQELPAPTHITCRAVAELGDFLAMARPFAGSGARLVLMKGPRWSEEKERAAEFFYHEYVLRDIVEFQLPISGAQRCLLLIDFKQSL